MNALIFMIIFLGIYLYIGVITWSDVVLYGAWAIGGSILGSLVLWIGFGLSEAARQKDQ